MGLGLRPNTAPERILAALAEVLPRRAITCLATIDRRAGEAGPHAAAAALGVPVRFYSVEALAGVVVPNPSSRTAAALGTPSVAEAAALLAGRGDLLLPRCTVDGIVIAAAAVSEDSATVLPGWSDTRAEIVTDEQEPVTIHRGAPLEDEGCGDRPRNVRR